MGLIIDETRKLTRFGTSRSIAEGVLDSVKRAALDRWAGEPAPQILCESRSLAGALRNLASRYACPITSTNGQVRGFLVSKLAPALDVDQQVLYIGDFDWCGGQIEAATRRTLIERAPWWASDEEEAQTLWERVALTAEQVEDNDLPVISKPDRRYHPVRYFDAVETEAFGQARIVAAVRDRLNELMPEPLDDVLERQERQRAEVADRLRDLMDGETP